MCAGRAIYETEANAFAGYLLVPTKELIQAYAEAKKKTITAFQKQKMVVPNDDKIVPFVAAFVAKQFEVSDQVAQIRLERIFKSKLL